MVMIRKIFCFMLFVVFSANAKVVIITDIDDTIKKANSMGKLGKIYHFFRKKIYPEMRDLFNELKEHQESLGEEVNYYYVSAAPDFIFNQQKWIKKHNFPIGPTYLKQPDSPETFTYKYQTIEKILKEYSDLSTVKFYFFGDNSSHDPGVYRKIVDDFQLNAEIFIRDVSTKATKFSNELEVVRLPGVNYFFSEIEFFDFQSFDFMSQQIREGIREKFQKMSLIPKYTFKTLYRRLKKVRNCKIFKGSCKKISKKEAKKLWNKYHHQPLLIERYL